MKMKKILYKFFLYIAVVLIFVWCVFPFYWAVISSLKPDKDLFELNPSLFPKRITFENYIKVFTERPFHINIWNSIVVSGITTILSLAIGSLAGYAIARFKFKGKVVVMSLILAVSMFPQVSILGSLFVILRKLKLINTYAGLILPYVSMTLPLTTWILQNFFRELPREVEESAAIDGCSKLRTLWSIVLPMAAPGLVATGLLTFISAWNEFLYALTFMQRPNKYTVPVAIALFKGASQYEIPWGQIMAAAVIVTTPLVILVLIFQKKIIAGLSAGSVKG
ncbi:sugar ABC transporter permease [Thermosipho melanesiensis]|uniref:Binding-protein-dependent transport systems inner membrane component n=2 Tax=Thermosipho melanesiensis TaxID=46541 RepID=A6LP02_THEM4|nr:carbohydrate ABC transporter permease [Thermosipho melanesiensis]ABR31653.1 binding-protein-dependent transport systems inner membrane component [Thermosipho melanesiensis BI429]APT74680.1 sugar ABC transporter permease [Thermosipho melanesiensis]OOC35178.1 sugar ABC transporter permease [Thermosipho melanesiensis]OOC35388.1 sugar ABC transporter permease [Thermosipho melanesiensis]OOC36639.1 sugar ABC transporter permease [Thermosipho melanesiensis]